MKGIFSVVAADMDSDTTSIFPKSESDVLVMRTLLPLRVSFGILVTVRTKACYAITGFSFFIGKCYMVIIVQSVRTPGCGPGGRGFESHWSPEQLQILDFRL